MPIELIDVSVTFGTRTLFARVNTRFHEGQMVSLVGPSGAGKSTLLAVISGFVSPTTGIVVAPPTTVFDWIFQLAPLLNRRSGIDNVALGAMASGKSYEESLTLAMPIIHDLGLSGVAAAPTYRLSGGERQRVAVGRSIARRPDVLLADEPTASLDPLSRELICNALRAAAAGGIAVVVATHDPWVAAKCDDTLELS
jgi:ABC-type lipoprotein export system ATPase subunit